MRSPFLPGHPGRPQQFRALQLFEIRGVLEVQTFTTMSRILSVSIFATAALSGFALLVLGLALDAFALGGFSLAVVSLFLLAAAGDYAPRNHRFEPSLVRNRSASARLPLAA